MINEQFRKIEKVGNVFNVGEYATIQILNEDDTVKKELKYPGQFSLTGGHGFKKYMATHGEYVHRLVAEAFCGAIPKGYTVNHKDGNILNNSASNLEIISNAENIRHAQENALSYSGPLDPITDLEKRIKAEKARKYNKQWGVYDLNLKPLTQFQTMQEAACYIGVTRQAINKAFRNGKPIKKQFFCCRIHEIKTSFGK